MVDFGEILTNIGDFGFFQQVVVLGLTFQCCLLQAFYCSFLFIQSDPERHCNTDWILRADLNLTTDEQLNLTLPRGEAGTFSRCQMFVPVDWGIDTIREYGLNETTGGQHGWVYYSTLYEFDLVCERANMAGAVQTVFMGGKFIGSLIFGPAAESFGLSGLSPNFYGYLVSQFIVGSAYGGYKINAVVLGMTSFQYFGPFPSCLSQLFGALGQCAIACLVYGIRDWRTAQYVLAGAQAFVFIYIWWIPESARWLLGHGRNFEANELICKVAAINKKGKVKGSPESMGSHFGMYIFIYLFLKMDLIQSSLCLLVFRFSLNLGYYCLILNVGNFGLSIFLVQFLFGITEVPAHLLCILVLKFVGRRKSLISILLTAGCVLHEDELI
uniref:Solute carrier family 22 member 13a n=1 Tax=Scophthalmus maximus TaxID=52904 RepID=A0A8D3AQM9_SCOMX